MSQESQHIRQRRRLARPVQLKRNVIFRRRRRNARTADGCARQREMCLLEQRLGRSYCRGSPLGRSEVRPCFAATRPAGSPRGPARRNDPAGARRFGRSQLPAPPGPVVMLPVRTPRCNAPAAGASEKLGNKPRSCRISGARISPARGAYRCRKGPRGTNSSTEEKNDRTDRAARTAARGGDRTSAARLVPFPATRPS